MLLALWLAAPATAGELRLATPAPEGSAWMKLLRQWGDKAAAATNGRVTHKYFPGGSQGGARTVVRKMRKGELDGAVLTAVGLSLIYPGIRVLELPFMFESSAEVDYVRGKMWPYFQEKFQAKGFHLAASGDIGWTYLYTRTPLTSHDDLAKVRIWAWQDDAVVRTMYRRMGINGVPLPLPEVLPALKSGRINGCYGSPLAAVALQWYTEFTHSTSMPVAYALGGMVVRTAAWDAATSADRMALVRVDTAMSTVLTGQIRADNARALDAMVAGGIIVATTPPELASEFEAVARRVWDELVGTVYTREELDMVLKYRAEFRKSRRPNKK